MNHSPPESTAHTHAGSRVQTLLSALCPVLATVAEGWDVDWGLGVVEMGVGMSGSGSGWEWEWRRFRVGGLWVRAPRRFCAVLWEELLWRREEVLACVCALCCG